MAIQRTSKAVRAKSAKKVSRRRPAQKSAAKKRPISAKRRPAAKGRPASAKKQAASAKRRQAKKAAKKANPKKRTVKSGPVSSKFTKVRGRKF